MNAARFADMSDLAKNWRFSRPWDEPPPQKRKRQGRHPLASSKSIVAQLSYISPQTAAQRAAQIDRTADLLLSVGRVDAAERLAHRAAEIRGATT